MKNRTLEIERGLTGENFPVRNPELDKRESQSFCI